jgi:hypothetical protein
MTSAPPASGRAGSEAMLAKLSGALFVDTLRRYVTGLPEQTTRLARGNAGPGRRQESRAAAPARESSVDDRGSRGRSRRVSIGAGGAFHPLPFRSANDVPDRMAFASGRAGPDRDAQGCGGHRGRRRLRVGSGVQSRVQASVRRATGTVPASEQNAGGPAGIRWFALAGSTVVGLACSHLVLASATYRGSPGSSGRPSDLDAGSITTCSRSWFFRRHEFALRQVPIGRERAARVKAAPAPSQRGKP